jgi:RNA polymerase sigma-70 factor (ECF subfamily)
LDHLVLLRIKVIQKAVSIVFEAMHLAVQKHAPVIARMAPQLRRLALSPGRARRSPLQMPFEATTDQMKWGPLIRAIATQQDRTAFSALFEYFAPRIKSFMQRSGASEAKAEELAQETMLAVWRKAGLFDPASTGAAAWIFTIARNLRIDAHRRERRGGVIETSDAEIEFQIDDSPQPDSHLATVQSEERIRSALAKLSADQIRVVELSFFDEKAHAEIAKILGIPLGTVKSRLRLAISRLRTLLSELS